MLPLAGGILGALSLAPLSGRVAGKCLVGQRCFPSASDLAAFNASIGGRLFAERPIGAVCYAKDEAFNEQACFAGIENLTWFHDQWISDHFPAYVHRIVRPTPYSPILSPW